ncbi:MAG: hypothetical protein ACFFFC_08765 [Candidatus Thorarchaeota archaeon]
MDRVESSDNITSEVIKPCPHTPKRSHNSSLIGKIRTQISRKQAAAAGTMSFVMIGILVSSLMPMPYVQIPSTARYNIDCIVVRFTSSGDFIQASSIRIANQTSNGWIDFGSVDIVECSDSGYALVSPILRNMDGTKTWSIQLSRLDDFGNVLWTRVFDVLNIEPNLSLVEAQSGGFVIAGSSLFFCEESNEWIREVFLIRTNGTGYPEWTQSYSNLSGVCSQSLVECENGDYAIAGTTGVCSNSKSDILLARMDPNGTLLWNTAIGGTSFDEGYSLLEHEEGGFIVVGSTQDEDYDYRVLMVRTAANGSMIWNRTFIEEGSSRGNSICSFDDGGFAITGPHIPYIGGSSSETLFLKVGSDGELISSKSIRFSAWTRIHGYYNDCTGHAITQSGDGGFIITGVILRDPWTDDWELLLLGTDNAGNLLWNSTYGGGTWATGCSLVVCRDGRLIVAGAESSLVG